MTNGSGFDPPADGGAQPIIRDVVKIGDPIHLQHAASKDNAFLSESTRWLQGLHPVETPGGYLEGPTVMPDAPVVHYITDAGTPDRPVPLAAEDPGDFARKGGRYGDQLTSGTSVVRIVKAGVPRARFLGIFSGTAYALYYPWPNRIDWEFVKVVDGVPAADGTPIRYTDTVVVRNKNAMDMGWPAVYLMRFVDSWAAAMPEPGELANWVIYPADD